MRRRYLVELATTPGATFNHTQGTAMQELTLAPDQMKRFTRWLGRHHAIMRRECTICAEIKWGLASRLFLFPALITPDNTAEFIRNCPFVALVCGSCGHTLFIDAHRVLPEMSQDPPG